VRGSSHLAHARALSARLEREGHGAIAIREAPEALEAEDLLEMVHAGILSATVADSHVAEAWARVLPDLVVEDAAVARGEDIAWATRPDAPGLKAVLDDFVARRWQVDRGTMATIYRRYFETTTLLRHPLALDERDRVARLTPVFQTHAEVAGFNWLVLLAQGFQESRLDARARSHVGAVGVMQLMPATAAEVGVRDLTDAAQNIRGGIAYMDRLRTRYFNDPAIEEADRVFFALASYNAGPNRINRLRAEAARRGLDPNRWFGQVERVVQARVGSEPVRYVANIRAYFLTYSGAAGVLAERAAERMEAREELGAREGEVARQRAPRNAVVLGELVAGHPADVVQLDQLREVVAAVRVPVQAVGGLSLEQAVACPRYGAPLVVLGAPLTIDAEAFRTAEGDLESSLRLICEAVHAETVAAPGTGARA
jgi:membrane-bound lytic murein transglycosylase MltF